MREQCVKWHSDCLATHQQNMYETLIYPHNLLTETVKAFTFEDSDGMETLPMRGYLALKEWNGRKHKYFLSEDHVDMLPIRVDGCEELFLKNSATTKSIILNPSKITPFRITPEQTFGTIKEFIDDLACFEHSNPDAWTLLKVCAIMGVVGKTFLGISTNPEFGKSSIFEIIHSITQKSPVFQPRSVPGVLIHISGDGNIVFDEVHQSNSDTKRCMENFTLQVAGNKPIYINGAIQTKGTKQKYNTSYQSITFLYNTYSNYKDPDNEFFDGLFSNNDAIDSRILKLSLNGRLTERFGKNFDIVGVAEANKMFYMRVAKELLWLKGQKLNNLYIRKYSHLESSLKLKGRRRIIFDELTWLLDQYCESEEEYKHYLGLLDKAVTDYKARSFSEYTPESIQTQFTGPQTTLNAEKVCETVVEETVLEKPLNASKEELAIYYVKKYDKGKGADEGDVINALPYKDAEELINKLLQEGDIFETSPGRLKVLE